MKCDTHDCENPAVFTCVWTGPIYVCPECFQKILGIAEAMGFPTPARTVRVLTMDEMLADDSESQS